jgi:hypothetical protein
LAYITLTIVVVGILLVPVSFVLLNGIPIQLSDVGGVLVEYTIPFVPTLPPITHVPLPNVIPDEYTGKIPVFGIPTHDSAVGGFASEYDRTGAPVAEEFPTTTQVPFPYAIFLTVSVGIFVTPLNVPLGIPTQLDATGGVDVEYAILFVPPPTATHVPFA